MSVAGPALLEAVLGRFRRWFQRDAGRRGRRLPAFGWRRWTPGLGALRDTYGAYRTALLLGIDTVDAAVAAYHQLCPDGSLRVAAALRARHTAVTVGLLTGPVSPGTGPGGGLPVDIMRRIPVDPAAYRRWLQVWSDLRDATDSTGLTEIAQRHGFSLRQIQWVRRAGQAGLLNSATPPAVRMAQLAAGDHRQPGNGMVEATAG